MDFPLFMRIFAQHSGLMRYTAVKEAPFWIPGRDGIWIPVRPFFSPLLRVCDLMQVFHLQADARFVDDVKRASSSFLSSGGPSTVFPLSGKSHGDDFRILDENLQDVLLFLGILVDDAKLNSIKADQKVFLHLTGDNMYSLPVSYPIPWH